MSLILVDIGNSAIKLSIVPSQIADSVGSSLDATCQTQRIKDWSEFDFETLPKAACIWTVACVNDAKLHELSNLLDQNGRNQDQVRSVHHDLVDLKIDVEQPDVVGIDRLIGCFTVIRSGTGRKRGCNRYRRWHCCNDRLGYRRPSIQRRGYLSRCRRKSCFQLNQANCRLAAFGLRRTPATTLARVGNRGPRVVVTWKRHRRHGNVTPPWPSLLVCIEFNSQGLNETVSQFKESLPASARRANVESC